MDPSNKKEDHSVENNLVNLEESYVIPSPTHDFALDGSQESEEEFTHEFIDDDPEYVPDDYTRYSPTPERLFQELRSGEEELAMNCSSDEWQELNKSDYAKVIFCDLYYHADSGSVGCKFQITDNVHEDPCDYVGLFRIGFENLTQCLVSKMLSKTKCEEDGKVISCDFLSEELPDIETGFYQFLYITRDKEICGASMPFEIKHTQSGGSSPDCIITEKGEDDFLLVRHSLEKKNQMLEELLAESQRKNRELTAALETMTHERDASFKEKTVVIESLQTAMGVLKDELAAKSKTIDECNNIIKTLTEQILILNEEVSSKELTLTETGDLIKEMSRQINAFSHKENLLSSLQIDKKHLQDEVRRLACVNTMHSNPDQISLVMQLDDQKFMIKALEDSKQLALREMSELSEALSKRTGTINTLKQELTVSRQRIRDLTEVLNQRTEEVKEMSVKLDACKLLKETQIDEIQQAEELQKVTSELTECQQKLNRAHEFEKERTEEFQKMSAELTQYKQKLMLSEHRGRGQTQEFQKVSAELTECKQKLKLSEELERKLTEEFQKVCTELTEYKERLVLYEESEGKLTEEYQKVSAELTECKQKLELSEESDGKLSGDVNSELELLRAELAYSQNEVNLLIERIKSDSTFYRQKNSVVKDAVKQCEELRKDLNKSLLEPSTSSVSRHEIKQKKCETLAHKGKIADIKILLEKVVDINDKPQGNLPSSGSSKVNKICLKKLENLHSVGSEDIAYINELTEKISRREPGFLLQVEAVPESDINTVLKDPLLCVERIINAVRSRLWTVHSNDWSSLISGYKGEYTELPIDLQIQTVLAECRSQYQIEILLEQVKKSVIEKHIAAQEKLTLESENLKCVSELEANITDLLKELEHIKSQCAQLESGTAEIKTQSSRLSDKLCDTNSKCMLLEEELQDLRTHYGEQKACLEESHAVCAQLRDECMKKDALIEFLKTEKGNLSSKQMQLQETVKEHTARLTEAAELYKKQFKEIEKLKKKLRKIKREPYRICASSETSDPPVVVLNDESKTSSPVHEIFYPARSSSDSDTGEHVSGDSTLREAMEKHRRAIRSSRKEHSDEKANKFKAALTRSIKSATNHEIKKGGTANLGDEVKRFLTKLPQDPKLPSPVAAAAPEEEWYPMPCPMCDQEIYVSFTSMEPLTNHLETQHHMSMCPICGHFFEESVPKRYLTYHIEGHFKHYEKAHK